MAAPFLPSDPDMRRSSDSSRSSSPLLSALDSSATLILVHDPEDNTPFEFDTDDEDDDHTPQFDMRRVSVHPLGPIPVFLYLLAPYLKLGAMFLPQTELPLKHGLPPLLIFAGLSAFSRQIWYMLARYMRTLDFEDVMLDAFARGRRKERRRTILRTTIRAGTGCLRILLATVYLRESTHTLLLLIPHPTATYRLALTTGLALAVFPLSLAHSVASKRAVYSTSFSLAAYLTWLSCVIYAYIHRISLPTSGWLRMGAFWQGITTLAFAFTSSSTLSLYASLRGAAPPITTAKPSKLRSFKTLSALSVTVALLLTVPLVFLAANPQMTVPGPPSSHSLAVSTAISVFYAATLLLGIPTLLITAPPLPVPDRIRHATTIPISKTLLSLITVGLALSPTKISVVINDVLLLSAFLSTYFLPALVHVTTHFFKRPRAFVIPPRDPQSTATHEGDYQPGPSGGSAADELLLRKERALQKRHFRRRLVWDLGVWVLIVGGGIGFVWAIGRVVGGW